MTPLVEVRGGVLRPLLPPGRDLAAWHAALTDEIARHLSPAHAALLAPPQPTPSGTAWLTDGARWSRFADLPAADRARLTEAVGAILSDLRRLAESGAAPAVRAAWPALREIPDMGHLFAVDGRPVLAAWGHAGTGAPGFLARYDDGVPWRAAPRPPWGLYGATLGMLALLALSAGLLLPAAGLWLVPPPAACAIPPEQLAALDDQLREGARGDELRTQLAALTEDLGRRQLTCPIPVLPQPAAPPAPPAAPPPRADLPQDRWDRRDIALMEGCWALTTTLSVTNQGTGRVARVRAWRMCFDGRGRGNQVIELEDGRRCEGRLAAEFDAADALRVTEPATCNGPTLELTRSERLCRRVSDTEATCDGHVLGTAPGRTYTGRFRR